MTSVGTFCWGWWCKHLQKGHYPWKYIRGVHLVEALMTQVPGGSWWEEGGGIFTRPVTTRMTTLRWQQCEQFCCYSVLHSSRRANPWTGEQKGKQKWIQKWVRLRTCKVLYHKVKSSWQLPVWQVYLQQLIMLEVQGGLTFLSDGADYKHTLLSSSPLLCVVHHCAQFESDCMHNISV